MRSPARVVLAIAMLAAAGAAPAAAQDDRIVVLAALPVTHSIASALAEGTAIAVEAVPDRPRPMGGLGSYLETRADQFAEQFRAAQAVVTIGKVWRDDPLFTAVRAANIRVVDIDASKPWSTTLEGVSVALVPAQADVPWVQADGGPRVPSVHFWLSLSNGVRAAEIVAADLARLAPGDAPRIRRNLAAYRQRLLDLKLEYEVRFASIPPAALFSLAPEFVYLTADMGLFVAGQFFKDDLDWTEEDRARLTSYLRDRDVAAVVHKWEPAEPIRAAIAAGGARLVVLDPIDLGVLEGGRLRADAYAELMRANLDALYGALAAPR